MLNIKEIKEILPHRYPFLLVDRVIATLSMEQFKGKTPLFAGTNKVRFKSKVVPGDRLDLYCEIIKIKGSIGIGKGIATVDGKTVCEAEILFAIG